MDYPYENLGPEKFQDFCQALIAREHPRTQCLPIGQPDGGRDAFVFLPQNARGLLVFQVKFVRNPFSESEPHKWLLRIMDAELPKIKELVQRGATEYYLLTNVPGTAHPDVGSIDEANDLLSTTFGLTSMCLWRNDLNRRLDSAWDLKWTYPELMTGPDFMRAILDSGLTEAKERRSAAIKAFLRSI